MQFVQLTDSDGDVMFVDLDKVVAIYKTCHGTAICLDYMSEVAIMKVREDPQIVANMVGKGHRRNRRRERPTPPLPPTTIKGCG